MIRHIVLFKLKPGLTHDDPRVAAAAAAAREVGTHVPCLRQWYAARNVSTRPVAYDFVVIGLVDDDAALEEYMTAPFHLRAIDLWREISDWVVVDALEDPPSTDNARDRAARGDVLLLGSPAPDDRMSA